MTNIQRMIARADARGAAEKKGVSSKKVLRAKPSSPQVERTAAPSVIDTPSGAIVNLNRARGRPKTGLRRVLQKVLVGLEPETVAWLDEEWPRRGVGSRVDLIRAILTAARDK